MTDSIYSKDTDRKQFLDKTSDLLKTGKTLNNSELFILVDLMLKDALDIIELRQVSKFVSSLWGNYPDYLIYLLTDKVDLSFMFKYRALDSDTKTVKTYLLKNMMTNHYKIGKTSQNDVMTRIRQIQVGAETKLIHCIQDDVENELHRKFKHLKVKGEWFCLSESDVKYITDMV